MRVEWYRAALAILGVALFVSGCGTSALTPPTAHVTDSGRPSEIASTAGATPELTEPAPSATAAPPVRDTPTATSEPAVTATVQSGNADVLFVRAVQSADGSWTFYVEVQHPDTGWEDYADGWDVVTPAGEVLKPDPDSQFTRTLLHPHVDEQPFTRSQGGIEIPEGVEQVRVRAHDLVDGYGGREVVVDLAVKSGPDFEVERRP